MDTPERNAHSSLFPNNCNTKRRSIWRLSISKIYKTLIIVSVFGVLMFIAYTVKTENKKSISLKEQTRSVLTTEGKPVSTATSVKRYQVISEPPKVKIQSDSDLSETTKRNKHNCSKDFWNSHLISMTFSAGRTGNYLFRYASLLAISKTVCFKAVRKSSYIRHFDNIFDLQNVEKIEGNLTFEFIWEHGYAKFDSKILSKISPDFNFTLRGYRQSYRYFQNQSEYVRSSFRFRQNITEDVNQLLSATWFQNKPKVCIHIRRKDMATKRTIEDGRVSAGMDFINSSINYMTNYLSPVNFTLIVVSDDKQWCTENIKVNNVFISPFQDAGRDLYLLTQCDHNIVTSGSYSWWGAWLNETGVVVYNKMFPLPNSDFSRGFEKSDYYPSHWIGM